MKAAKSILAIVLISILAGCVANGNGQGLHFGQPEFYDRDPGLDRGYGGF